MSGPSRSTAEDWIFRKACGPLWTAGYEVLLSLQYHLQTAQAKDVEGETDVEIQGKKAVIVGGASGMARATAELLRQRAARIAILDLPSSAGAEVATELGGTFHEVNILDEHQTESALADAVAALDGLHIAVIRRVEAPRSAHCPRMDRISSQTSAAQSS